MPSFGGAAMLSSPGRHPRQRATIRTRRQTATFTITGVTKDSTGAALGNCTVALFRAGDDSFVARTTSDGSGNYTFAIGDNAGYFYVRSYKAGAPDVAGTTVNTLVAT